MTVKEYANKMGLTVNGLCEVTGMSRMGLNNILAKGIKAEDKRKRFAAVNNLMIVINEDVDRKIMLARQECVERVKMLDMFYNE